MSEELSRWRLAKAQQTFIDGEHLENLGSFGSAVNRYYYAGFHAARALLATKGLDSPKHKGIISLFNKEFVKTGIVSRASGKALSDLFSMRSDADYDDFIQFSEEEVVLARQLASTLIQEVKVLLG